MTPEHVQAAIGRLRRRIRELEEFDTTKLTQRFTPEIRAIQAGIGEALAFAFGERTDQFNRYSRATTLDHAPLQMRFDVYGAGRYRDPNNDPEAARILTEGKTEALALLGKALRGLEEHLADTQQQDAATPAGIALPQYAERRVFIVHGHEEGPRETVARFLEKIGFEAIILHEQANQGMTIIEKVERHGEVPFAVVLLTPDDVGSVKGAEPQPRARQNVILELGYFIGRLGRDRVCALKSAPLEIPSDIHGVAYVGMEGDWRRQLAQELQAVGFGIDWNSVMNPGA